MLKTATDIWELIGVILAGAFGWGLSWGRVVKKHEIYKENGEQIYLTVAGFNEATSKIQSDIAGIKKHCERQDTTLTSVEKLLARLDERSKIRKE